jgi:LacI family transcriptional regulator
VIRGPEKLFDSAPRWEGVQQAAREAGIRLDERLIFQLPGVMNPASSFEGGLECARRMLAAGVPFTAVLAFDDLTALGVVRGLTEAGRHVPEDCSVLGFDDVLPAAVATPSMTTIRQPLKEMGVLAAEWMLDSVNGREHLGQQGPRLFRAQPELVVRVSAAAAAQRKEARSTEKVLDKAEDVGENLHCSND